MSPPWFPNLGWPLEDQELALDQKLIWPVEDVPFLTCHNRREIAMSSDSLPNFSSSPREVCYEGPDALDDPSAIKKLSHNANERDRRKKLNTLYSSLRALLPKSDRPVISKILNTLIIIPCLFLRIIILNLLGERCSIMFLVSTHLK